MDSPDEEMNLYFKLQKTITLKVKRSHTIKNLKVMMREKEGIVEDLQELFFAGNRLGEDGFRVMDYGIPKNSTINVVHKESSGMKLYFKVPTDLRKFELVVQNSDTIQRIKSIIEAKEGIHPSKYVVYYAGKLLENYRTVASLKIQSEATLQMISTPKDTQLISVYTLSGDKMEVEVKCTHTVLDFKKILESITNIPTEDFELFIHGDTKLQNSKMLSNYDIKGTYQLLKMKRVTGPTYEIYVKNPAGKTIPIEVTPSDTFTDLKEKLYPLTDIVVFKQRILFNGRQYDDDKTLSACGVHKFSKLQLILRLLGGKQD